VTQTSRSQAASLDGPTGDATARRLGNAGLAVTGLAVLLMVWVTFMGPSNVVPKTGGQLSLNVRPSPWLSLPLVWAVAGLAAIGPCLGLLAIRRGWRPASPRTLLLVAAGIVVVLAVLPVGGSTDVLSYAIYGRIGALGHDPFSWVPQRLIHAHDPVARYAPAAWRKTPSLYGPVATGIFQLAAMVCGASMAKIVFLLKLVMGASFGFTAWALDRLAGSSAERRARVLVLWTLNPAMLWACVVSGHVDGLAMALVVAALLVVHTAPLPRWAALPAAGVLLGGAAGIKAPLILAGLAFAWTCRRSVRDLVALGAGGLLVLGTAYLAAGRKAVHVLVSKSDSYSPISPWRWPLHLIKSDLWQTGPMSVIGLVSGVLLVALLIWKVPEGRADLPEVRPLFVLLCGWLVVSPLQRPWYDAVIFSTLALMPRTAVDELLVVRGGMGMLGFLPGVPSPQPHPYPGPMYWTAKTFVPWRVSAGSSLMVVLISLRLLLRRDRPRTPA
jgi:hypothetical protein